MPCSRRGAGRRRGGGAGGEELEPALRRPAAVGRAVRAPAAGVVPAGGPGGQPDRAGPHRLRCGGPRPARPGGPRQHRARRGAAVLPRRHVGPDGGAPGAGGAGVPGGRPRLRRGPEAHGRSARPLLRLHHHQRSRRHAQRRGIPDDHRAGVARPPVPPRGHRLHPPSPRSARNQGGSARSSPRSSTSWVCCRASSSATPAEPRNASAAPNSPTTRSSTGFRGTRRRARRLLCDSLRCSGRQDSAACAGSFVASVHGRQRGAQLEKAEQRTARAPCTRRGRAPEPADSPEKFASPQWSATRPAMARRGSLVRISDEGGPVPSFDAVVHA